MFMHLYNNNKNKIKRSHEFEGLREVIRGVRGREGKGRNDISIHHLIKNILKVLKVG